MLKGENYFSILKIYIYMISGFDTDLFLARMFALAWLHKSFRHAAIRPDFRRSLGSACLPEKRWAGASHFLKQRLIQKSSLHRDLLKRNARFHQGRLAVFKKRSLLKGLSDISLVKLKRLARDSVHNLVKKYGIIFLQHGPDMLVE